MLPWFRQRTSTAKGYKDVTAEDKPLTLMLIEELLGQIAAPQRASSVLASVARFQALPPADQEKALPATYLLLEQYLAEVDAHRKFTREQWRDWVRGRYKPLLTLPNFNLIFQSPHRQEVLLCRHLLEVILKRAHAVLGATGQNLLVAINEWISGIPHAAALRIPFDLAGELPQSDEEWVALLGKLSQKLYWRLERNLGAKAAGRIFENSYQELADGYMGLEPFPVVVGLLPDHLLDEQKIHLLSRSQMQRVLLDKVEHLQKINEQLASKNHKLERAQSELLVAGEAVAASTTQLSAVLNTVGEGIVTIDSTGTIVMVNQEVQNIWGYRQEELIGKNLQMLMPEKYRAAHAAGLTRYLQTGVSRVLGQRSEFEGLKKEGTIFPLEIRITETKTDERLLFTAAVRDITERKRAQEALIASERRFRELFYKSPDAIFVEDFSGEVLDINPAACRLHGLARKEIIGKSVLELVPPDKREEVARDFARLVKGELDHVEGFSQAANGHAIPVEITVGHTDYSGKSALLLHVRDITERKRAEEALRQAHDLLEQRVQERTAELEKVNAALLTEIEEHKRAEEALQRSEKHFRALIENASDIITIVNVDGTIRYESPSIERVVGYKPEELVGKYAFDFVHPDDSSHVLNIFNDALQNPGATRSVEFRFRHKNGSWRILESIGKAVVDDSGEASVVVNSRDITEQKRAEQTLKKYYQELEDRSAKLNSINEKLVQEIQERERAERELKRSQEELRNLSAHLEYLREEERTMIAREIHDELGQVLSTLKMDLGTLENHFPKDQKILFEITHSMAELIYLAMQRVKKISQELRPSVLDLLTFPQAVAWQIDVFKNTTGISCQLAIQNAEDLQLTPNAANALFRVLQEALTNIIRHAEATKVIIALEKTDAHVMLEIQDNGKGITNKEMADPRSFGLIGMRERIHHLNGNIEINSSMNQGTTIVCTIPIK